MSKEMLCPTCGMRLPIDPKDATIDPDAHRDAGRTIETVIPGTVSAVDIAVPSPRVNGSSVLLASPNPEPVLGRFVAGDTVAAPEAAAETRVPTTPAAIGTPLSTDALTAPEADPVVAVPTSEVDRRAASALSARGSSADGDAAGRRRASWSAVLLGSYASAMTLVCLWLWSHGRGRPEAPPADDPAADSRFERGLRGDRSSKIKPLTPIPAERLTEVGQSLTVNKLEVTPLGVERAPIRLEHTNLDQTTDGRDGETAVLILRLRLKNLSEDQIFAPLDEAFVRPGERGLCDSVIETAGAGRIEMYPLAASSEWSIAGQEFRELKPGETLETFVAADENASSRESADMTWRLHLRTAWDHTEVVGVRFRRDDVK